MVFVVIDLSKAGCWHKIRLIVCPFCVYQCCDTVDLPIFMAC